MGVRLKRDKREDGPGESSPINLATRRIEIEVSSPVKRDQPSVREETRRGKF